MRSDKRGAKALLFLCGESKCFLFYGTIDESVREQIGI